MSDENQLQSVKKRASVEMNTMSKTINNRYSGEV